MQNRKLSTNGIVALIKNKITFTLGSLKLHACVKKITFKALKTRIYKKIFNKRRQWKEIILEFLRNILLLFR